MSANDKQVAGSHYKAAEGGLQHWDLCDDYDVPYLVGCATKYLTRFRRKNGLQDLQKALHYVEKIIEAYGSHHRDVRYISSKVICRFFKDNGITGPEREPIRLLLTPNRFEDIKIAQTWIETLIAEFDGSAPSSEYTNQD